MVGLEAISIVSESFKNLGSLVKVKSRKKSRRKGANRKAALGLR